MQFYLRVSLMTTQMSKVMGGKATLLWTGGISIKTNKQQVIKKQKNDELSSKQAVLPDWHS